MKMRRVLLPFFALFISVFIIFPVTEALACTAVYVGPEASADGTTIIARSNDAHPTVMPTIVKVFCNRYAWMPTTYARFLENGLRKTFSLAGCPLKLEWTEKPQKEGVETMKAVAWRDKKAVPRDKRVQNVPKDG